MQEQEVLEILKINLGIAGDTYDRYLRTLIEAAKDMIAREGIMLGASAEDYNLVTMYAAYLFRKRAADNPVMPRMLRYALNNRLFAQKAGGSA